MFHIMLFQLSSPNGQVVTKSCSNATSWWGLRSSIFASSWGRSPSPPRVRVSLEVDRPHGKAIAKCGYPRLYSIRRLLAACSWKSGLQGASASGLPCHRYLPLGRDAHILRGDWPQSGAGLGDQGWQHDRQDLQGSNGCRFWWMVRFGDPTIEQSSHQSVLQQPVLGGKNQQKWSKNYFGQK